MGKGFVSGLIWGGVAFGAGFLVLAALHDPPAPELPDPGGRLSIALPKAPVDTGADHPPAPPQREAAGTAGRPGPATRPKADTTPPEAPTSPGRPLARADAGAAPDAVEAGPPEGTASGTPELAPALTAPLATTRAPAGSSTAPDPEADPMRPHTARTPAGDAPEALETSDDRQPQVTAAAEPVVPDLIRPPIPTSDQVPFSEAENELGRITSRETVRTDRLPRIGDVALPEGDEAAPDAGADPDAGAELRLDLPAVLRNAARVDLDTDRPRMALILIDDGIDPALRADIAALPFAVSIALDPMAEGAAQAATEYRAAGMELLILASALPARATASDIDVTFENHFATIPQAVGVIDLPEGGFQRNTSLAQNVVSVLERDGHALVSFAGGLNTAARTAAGAGLAQGQVFRVLDDADQSIFVIRRYLDRAVFEATREGSVIVLGHADRPDTLPGILSWRMEGRASEVALVPVSAALDGP